MFLVAGLAVSWIADYAQNITRLTGNGDFSLVARFINIGGLSILLLGLRRKGFYSITPSQKRSPPPSRSGIPFRNPALA